MGGGMEAHKNRWIEDWSTARENLEHNFRWTRRNLALVGIFGVAVPVLIYKGIVKEFISICSACLCFISIITKLSEIILHESKHMQDEDAGRPYRKFW